MNLIQALAGTSFKWSLSTKDIVSTRTGARGTVLCITGVLVEGSAPVEQQFSTHTSPSVESMLVAFLAKQDPTNAVLAQWRLWQGNEVVQLENGVMDCLGEAMHRGLRKLADSPQSTLTWNALHQVNTDDRITVWKTAQQVITDAFASGEPVIRRELAFALREAINEALDSADTPRVERTEAERFAMRTLIAGCQLTTVDEWMWSWLGYVLKTVPAASEAQPVAA